MTARADPSLGELVVRDERAALRQKISKALAIVAVVAFILLIVVWIFSATRKHRDQLSQQFSTMIEQAERLENENKVLTEAIEVSNRKRQEVIDEFLKNQNELIEENRRLAKSERRLSEGVNPNSDLDLVIGRSGSGFVSSTAFRVEKAHVFSFGGPFNDPELGRIWLPNFNEGRAFVVAPNSPLPTFVYHVDMPEEDLVPVAHPTRVEEETGKHFVVFVKKG